MTIYNLYIFDRLGTCLYYGEWNRKKKSGISQDEEMKLMYGMLFSIKSFVNRISPIDPWDTSKDGFISFRTNQYKCHFFETPSGLKFILNTDLSVGNILSDQHQLYSSIYVEYVIKNPLCELGKPIKSELFKAKLDEFIKSLSYFPPVRS